VLLFLAWIWRT